MTASAFDRLLDRLRANGKAVRQDGPNHAMAQCPSHEDRTASLSITLKNDRVLLHCHAECDSAEILAILGWTWEDLRPDRPTDRKTVIAEYPYTDESGKALFFKERYDPKDFKQFVPLPDGSRRYKLDGIRRVLFGLPAILKAIEAEEPIYIAEGEKDALALEAAGAIATTWPEGAWKPGAKPKWRDEYSKQLAGAHAILVRDRDENGCNTAGDIAAAIKPYAASVKIMEPAEGKDAYDHLKIAGLTIADLVPVDDHDARLEQHTRGGEQDGPKRRIRLTPASSIKPRPVRWAWTDRIPAGELTLTPGRGGIGKSTFHTWVIAHITRGTLPGVHFDKPMVCIIAASEDSWERTIVPRLIAAGADLDLVHRVDVITETNEVMSVSSPRDIDRLTEEITRIDAALLSVDPVMSLLSNTLDTHKDSEVRRGLEPLGRLADQTGCSVLGNAHFNKSTGSDPLSLIMGSAAFGNVARAALGFARDTDDEEGACVISQVKNNLGRLDLPSLRYRIDGATVDTEEGPAEVGRLVMLGESDRSVSDILRTRDGRDDREGHRDIDVWLTALLRNGRMEANDIYRAADASGYSKDQAKGAKKRLRILATHPDIKGPWFWEMPQGSNQESQGSGGSETGSLSPLDAPLDAIETVQTLLPGTEILNDEQQQETPT